MARVLIIEDEPNVAIALRDSLESEGYTVVAAADGGEGYRLAFTSSETWDLIMLDLMLPRMSGLEVCQRLRAAGVETPIIMLTARGAASDAAFGLKLGADDYIPKPFDVGELLARVAAVLRRARAPRQPSTESAARIGDVELDLRRLRASRAGAPLDLSPREFEILQLLIWRRGETVTREQLLHHIWGEHASLYTRTIDAHITRLRRKLEPDPANPRHIITVHRVGYRLVV